MKTRACFLLLFALSAGPCLAGYELAPLGDGGISVSLDFGDMEDVFDQTGTWAGCEMPGFDFSMGESLGLHLPADVMLFGIPATGDVRLSILGAEVRDSRDPLPEWPAAGRPRLTENLPETPAEITATGFMRNQRVAAVRICPVIFDHGVFRIYQRLRIGLTFVGAGVRGNTGAGIARDDSFEGVYRSLLVNYEQAKAWRRRAPTGGLRAAQDDYFSSSPNWVKVRIGAAGIYRITGSELAAAGVSLNAIDPSTLRLYGGGGLPLSESLLESNPAWMEQMALKVCDGGDGSFDAGDSLIFYGLGVRDWTDFYDPGRPIESYYKSFFSNFNYYWISWGGSFSAEPSHMRVRSLKDCDGCDYYQVPSFLDRVHVESDALADFSIRADDGWYWRPLRPDETVRLHPDTPFADPDREGLVKVRVADWHPSSECVGDYYRLIVGFNGEGIADSVWRAGSSYRNVVDIREPVGITGGESQEITVRMSRDIPPEYPGGECGKLYLAWYELYYWRRLEASDNRLFFFSPDSTCLARYVSGGFTTPSVYAFDITDQYDATELENFTVTGATGFQVDFYDSAEGGALRRYAIVAAGSLLKPAGLAVTSPADIRHRPGNEYVVITHEDLRNAARTIADYHGGEVVTVGEIYDEFAWGVPDVTAIRDFLRWRFDRGLPLHRVLLLGDASWDYRGLKPGGGYPNYVPAYERRYLPPVGDPYCTDDFFGYLTPNAPDGSTVADSVDYYLDVALSRLPASSPAEAGLLVSKAIAYMSDPPAGRWQNRICLVADDDKVGSKCDARPHTRDMEDINDQAYPDELERVKVYLTEYPVDQGGLKTSARADFISALDSGVLMANFVGHGDEYRLAQEEVLNPSSIPLVNTGRKEFFFIAASCNVSRFDEPTLSSMSEDLLERPDGGSIGSLASTHFCDPGRNKALNTSFVQSLFYTGRVYPVRTISDAIAVAKAETGSAGIPFRSNNEMFALFGDPGLAISSPRLEVEFDPPPADTLDRKGIYRFSGRVLSGDTAATWLDGAVDIIANEAQDTTGYMSCQGFLDYELPGNEIFRGRAGVAGGEFSFDFFVSADAAEGRRAQIRGILAGAAVTGAGLLDSLTISGEAESNDKEGPTVLISTNGGTVSPGDTLTARAGDLLRLDLSDSSGVAIRGKSAFIPSVSITMDDGDRIDLTDSVYAETGDFRQSYAYFSVPAAPAGAHDLVVSAFDNLNNFSQESFKVVIKASVEGETNVVHVFPNPASGLSYIICEYERQLEVEVSLFTVTGREIWTYKSPDARAYHEIPWRGRDAAGDPVANGTYLVRVEAKDPEDPSFTLTGNAMLAVIR